MHQMIPHHENAVNMAKVLLKNPGDEDLDEEVNREGSQIQMGGGRFRHLSRVGKTGRVLIIKLHEEVDCVGACVLFSYFTLSVASLTVLPSSSAPPLLTKTFVVKMVSALRMGVCRREPLRPLF